MGLKMLLTFLRLTFTMVKSEAGFLADASVFCELSKPGSASESDDLWDLSLECPRSRPGPPRAAMSPARQRVSPVVTLMTWDLAAHLPLTMGKEENLGTGITHWV